MYTRVDIYDLERKGVVIHAPKNRCHTHTETKRRPSLRSSTHHHHPPRQRGRLHHWRFAECGEAIHVADANLVRAAQNSLAIDVSKCDKSLSHLTAALSSGKRGGKGGGKDRGGGGMDRKGIWWSVRCSCSGSGEQRSDGWHGVFSRPESPVTALAAHARRS